MDYFGFGNLRGRFSWFFVFFFFSFVVVGFFVVFFFPKGTRTLKTSGLFFFPLEDYFLLFFIFNCEKEYQREKKEE